MTHEWWVFLGLLRGQLQWGWGQKCDGVGLPSLPLVGTAGGTLHPDVGAGRMGPRQLSLLVCCQMMERGSRALGGLVVGASSSTEGGAPSFCCSLLSLLPGGVGCLWVQHGIDPACLWCHVERLTPVCLLGTSPAIWTLYLSLLGSELSLMVYWRHTQLVSRPRGIQTHPPKT